MTHFGSLAEQINSLEHIPLTQSQLITAHLLLIFPSFFFRFLFQHYQHSFFIFIHASKPLFYHFHFSVTSHIFCVSIFAQQQSHQSGL